MRALLNKIAQERKIVFSLVFVLALVGATVAMQGFFTDSNVTSAQIINSQNTNNSNNNNGGGGKGEDGNNGDSQNGRGGGNGSGNAELCGFAWGATAEPVTPKMGLGWVSFNSKDCDIDGNGQVNASDRSNGAPAQCPDGRIGKYSVTVDSSSNLVGAAWSSNFGWLRFGGLSGFPTSHGSSQKNARIDGDGTVNGWARFCAGTQTGSCSVASRTDGWDGWVSLSGTSPSYGVKVSQDDFSGYSWGSSVVGWLNWSTSAGNGVRYCESSPNQSLAVTLNANPTSGPVVLQTRLTASYQLTSIQQRMVAQVPGTPSYKFKCDSSDEWSAAQTSNSFDCSYSQPATTFYPRAQVTLGSLVSEGSTEVRTDDNPTNGGELVAVCTVSRPAYVNQDVVWTVTLGPSGPTTLPYIYTFNFADGQSTPVVITDRQTTVSVTRTYPAPGNKTLSVTVTDSAASPSTATGTCNQTATVIVRPVIIPI